MDLTIIAGIIVGLLGLGIAFMFWHNARGRKRKAAKLQSDEITAAFKESSKSYAMDLSERIQFASDREEYSALREELDREQERLALETYTRFTKWVDDCLSDIAAEEAEAAERAERRLNLVPQLVEFRGLRNVEDPAILFAALHRLLVVGEKTIAWKDFDDYDGWEDEDWDLISRYDQLLNNKLRELLVAARDSTPEGREAYRAARLLQEAVIAAWGLDEFERTIEDDVFVLWLEATALHSRRLGREDLANHKRFINSLLAESMGEIARDSERGDLPSMQMAWMLLDEGDYDFERAVLERIRTKLGAEIDDKRSALGFVEEVFEEELVASA